MKKILFFITLLMLIFLSPGTNNGKNNNTYNQQNLVEVGYSFINFKANYDFIKDKLLNSNYEIKEKEIKSIYGQYLIVGEIDKKFFKEKLYLFFDNTKSLIFFRIEFYLAEEQSHQVLEKLFDNIRNKFISKYGNSESENLPYYKKYLDLYEIILYPLYPSSNSITISFKYLKRYNEYVEYYKKEITKEEDQAIESAVGNF